MGERLGGTPLHLRQDRVAAQTILDTGYGSQTNPTSNSSFAYVHRGHPSPSIQGEICHKSWCEATVATITFVCGSLTFQDAPVPDTI